MNAKALVGMSAVVAARAIAGGRLTSERYAAALLERVREREPAVQAWVRLDTEAVMAAARAADRGPTRGPLHGVPIGIKDVIDVAGLPTACNSPIHRDHVAAGDAVCVAHLRAAGALVMGKTVTTEFAFMAPGPTRHPEDPARTPGGSSSGSGAAVAAGMTPAALGTQTGGSTIRPAAYCGVVGYKPAFGRIPFVGTRHLAPSLDTIGVIARDLEDVATLAAVMAGEAPAALPPAAAPSLVLFLPFAERAEPATVSLLERVAARAASRGARVRRLEPPPWFAAVDPAHRVIMAVETAFALRREWEEQRGLLSESLAGFIGRGRAHTAEELGEARRIAADCRRWLGAALERDELVLTASTPGEAPLGLAATG
ncbi:MAG: amidase, partial [Alphaproteobacteria bacterium]|nr:amidase [Alphaproteobacteria bacterium]